MLKVALRASVALAGLLALSGAGAASTLERIALVIGNSHYSDANLDLGNASRDAEDVAASLERVGFKVLLKTDLGLSAFQGALSEFAREAEHSDMALFYYAGHGVQYKGENYFLPVDNIPRDNKDIKFRSVAMSQVVDATSYSQKIKIIILDACRNSVPDPGAKGTRAVTGIGDASGLAPISGSDGMIVFYSAEHGHQAFDATLGSSNSPFAASLVRHVAEPGRDVKEVFTEVTKDVLDQTEKLQHPEIVTAELTTNVYLNPAESAEDVWRRIRELKDPQAFRDFIRRFPDFELADAAQLRLDKFDADRRLKDDERARQDAEAKAAAAAADRDAAEQRATAQREAEKAQTERLKADKEASERALADKLATLEATRKAAEQQVADEKRRADEAAAEAARVAKENAAKEAEAQRLAKEAALANAKAESEVDAQGREAARAEAEAKAQAARQAAEQAQRLEAAKQVAKLEEETQRERAAEEAAKVQAEACARDRSALGDLRAALNTSAILSLEAKTVCASIGADIDASLKDVAKRQAAQCVADQKTVAAIGQKDLEGLKNALPSLQCAKVVDAASTLVARLEQAALDQEKACDEEKVKLAAVDAFVPGARDALQAFAAKGTCAAVRAAAKDDVAAADVRVKQAQAELARVGCLSAPISGRFDAYTVKAVANYLQARRAPTQVARITDAFVEELRSQDFKVCTPPVAARPAARTATAPAHEQPRAAPRPKRISARAEIVRPAPRLSPASAAPRRHETQAQSHPAESAPKSIMGTGF